MDFKGIVETIKWNKSQPTIEEESLENNECPEDMWPLKINEKGQKSCPVCGRIFS